MARPALAARSLRSGRTLAPGLGEHSGLHGALALALGAIDEEHG